MVKVIKFPSNYDDWKLSSGQDDEVIVCECEHCGGEIYEGDEIYRTSEGIVHDDCFVEFAHEVLESEPDVAER